LLENRFIASAFFSNLHLPLCDSLCEVILKNRFCQTAIGDPIKHRGPYFAIFADSIAVFNTPVVWPTYASNLVHWMIWSGALHLCELKKVPQDSKPVQYVYRSFDSCKEPMSCLLSSWNTLFLI